MTKDIKSTTATRRKFLGGAAVAGVASVVAPSVVKAQGPINLRFQSTWPSKDIFHEYAQDFGKRVTDMTGGDLKIEVLPAGAVVPAFGLLDAVSKGVLDGGHGVLVYHYGKNTALALRSEEHTSELQSHSDLVCRLLLEKKKKKTKT